MQQQKTPPSDFMCLYKITGAKHDGYCSGEENEEFHDAGFEYILLKDVERLGIEKYMTKEKWNDALKGLSSYSEYNCGYFGGSGYCKGKPYLNREARDILFLDGSEIIITDEYDYVRKLFD